MNNTYIPNILKDKLSLFFKYLYCLTHLLISIFLFAALLSFDINDDSFLTKSSQSISNWGGKLGSYISSFILYTFGFLGYAFIFFFLLMSILTFIKTPPKHLFIRLLLFFISLIFIPQTFLYLNLEIKFIEQIEDWGIIAHNLYTIHQYSYVSYFLTFVGIVLFLSCLNIHKLFKIPRFKIQNFFKNEKKQHAIAENKKEPIISRIPKNNEEIQSQEENKNRTIKVNEKIFSSPSLDILESEKINSKRKLEKENIKENSNLLEKVFHDFNIEVQVMTVRLGPVVTLYEILPSAGTKINTIINLAGDISISMGVGAVRIAQIYGTQYLGVEIPNKHRETVTIKELLSDNNFKNTEHKIPICIGKDISGKIEVIDLSKTPHLLVAGTT